MKKLMILLGLGLVLTGCESKEPEKEIEENQESEVQGEEKDYEHLQKMVDYYDDIVDDGLPYAVKHLAKFVSDCENKCQSLYMAYEDSLKLIETQAFDEWFDENYVKPIPNTTPLNSMVEVTLQWNEPALENGMFHFMFHINNKSITHSIKKIELELSYFGEKKERKTFVLDVSVPPRELVGADESFEASIKPVDFEVNVKSVEWEQE